jgi:hypothetical protein
MQIETSNLIDATLDWAVAKITNPQWWDDGYMDGDPRAALEMDDETTYTPSTDWSQGGPIIEQNEIMIHRNAPSSKGREWEAMGSITAKGAGYTWGYGPTPLVAAMRCYVKANLGEVVDVPNELF